MGRSRKKVGCLKDKSKLHQRLAAKKVRRIGIEFTSTSKAFYKRLYPSWSISDWRALYFRFTPDQLKQKLWRDIQKKMFRK